MVFGKLHSAQDDGQDHSASKTAAATNGHIPRAPTALYTYLNETLKSPELRRILEEGAAKHRLEAAGARGT